MGKVLVLYERWKCIGCGACAAVCPEHWEMADDNKSDLIGADIDVQNEEQKLTLEEVGGNKNAEESCPVNCIHVKE